MHLYVLVCEDKQVNYQQVVPWSKLVVGAVLLVLPGKRAVVCSCKDPSQGVLEERDVG